MANRERNSLAAPPFQMPSRELLESWWYGFCFNMSKANAAREKLAEADAFIEERARVNNWAPEVLREQKEKSWGMQDAYQEWQTACAEATRFKNAIDAAAQMKRLLGHGSS